MRDLTVMYLAAVIIGNISFSFMLVGIEIVRHNSPLFHSKERAGVAKSPDANPRSTALTHPSIPPN